MHIVIHNIDNDSSALRGFSRMESYRVRFSSQTFSGTARLVPACVPADIKPGAIYEVEVAQESVSGFRAADIAACTGVEAIFPSGDFKVRGTVCHVEFPPEPVGNRITQVDAGDALFCLELEDIGELRPEIGTAVEFIVHDMSMWDEAL